MQDLIVLTSDQLQKYFDDMVQKVEFIIKNSQKKEVASKELLTAKEVCTLLKISHTTLHDWSNKGVIQKHHVGVNRIRFRHDEIIESIQRMEAKKKRI
ncbi:MAG: helix-turn-helix domain-containing protein [Saprospiraceae bacterium]|uniref:Helix-turn-helix domain-containing protein n=1 Tax=Candidatus Defluviibacterium haderslevense TaxID=2981993 RepID=A0A9D7XIB0_9BACT|nr:helix-turn-helix domain-containing protein [Candidatus Defluviibacterium haderslevense]